MGNTFSNYYGSSAFPALVSVHLINMVICNKEPLMRFELCLRKQGHIYTYQINCGWKYDGRRPSSLAIGRLLLFTIGPVVGVLSGVELHTSRP
jgi:hypothetical protein